MKIITSGSGYIDIDAYACMIAYAELLNLQGEDALAVSTSPLNESISASVRSWNAPLTTTYSPKAEDRFVMVDVSEVRFFEKFVDLDKVVEVIDHHPGTEQFWQERIGEKAQIEYIGASATQIYLRWQAAGLLDKLSVTSARLLIAAILDNTLNFGAGVTTQKDKDAYADLLTRADLPVDWSATYFKECEEKILSDVRTAIINDTKVFKFLTFPKEIVFGQLVVWNTEEVLQNHAQTIEEALLTINENWLMNLVNVGERKSYFIAKDKEIKDWVSNLLNISFEGDVAQADRLWLRKELLKLDINNHAKV